LKISRLVGVLVTAGLLSILVTLFRPTENDTSGEGQPLRGGQLVAAIQSEPLTFNPYVATDEVSLLVSRLTQASLVRVNPSTLEVEPWLAERWESTPDGRSITFHIRPGLEWSDGTAFSSADVLFSVRAIYDPASHSPLATTLIVGGQPVQATAPDAATVVVSFAEPYGPGPRLLDLLPILPRHALDASIAEGTFSSAWTTNTPPRTVVGMGPFVLTEHQPGQQIVLERNPRYWRVSGSGLALPYLDRLVLRVVPDHGTELALLESGAIDLLSSAIRVEDYVPVRRLEERGKVRLMELGVAPSADAFWFCLDADAKRTDPRFTFVRHPEFRQAISHAVDREAFAETVFRGSAVPVWGPTTPGNTEWFSPNLPRYVPSDVRARELLRGIGLEDRNGDGVVEDARGVAAQFTVITERGVDSYERGTSTLRDELGRIGIALDITPVDAAEVRSRVLTCDYDAMYLGRPTMNLDPALNLDFWLSSGEGHLWNRAQRAPGTEWERRIDYLMLELTTTLDPERRRQQFNAAQRILAENLPILYFAAPRMYYAHAPRVRGIVPSVLPPHVLWNTDSLSVTPERRD
jgi:peptide/nickel transport system substrate-binding protein